MPQNAKFGHSFFQLKMKRKQRFKIQQKFQYSTAISTILIWHDPHISSLNIWILVCVSWKSQQDLKIFLSFKTPKKNPELWGVSRKIRPAYKKDWWSYRIKLTTITATLKLFHVKLFAFKDTFFNSRNVRGIDHHFSYYCLIVHHCTLSWLEWILFKNIDVKKVLNTNISSVMEWQRWWILKSNIFGQESI